MMLKAIDSSIGLFKHLEKYRNLYGVNIQIENGEKMFETNSFEEFNYKMDQCSGRLILGNMWTAMTSIPCGGSNIQKLGGLVVAAMSTTKILPPSAETAHTFPRPADICSAPFRWFEGPTNCSQQSLSGLYLLKDPVS